LLQESSFFLSFCLTVLVYQPVSRAALEGQYPDDKDAGAQAGECVDLFKKGNVVITVEQNS